MRNTAPNYQVFLIFSIVLVGVLLANFIKYRQEQQLWQNTSLASGRITNLSVPRGFQQVFADYEYEIDGKVYSGRAGIRSKNTFGDRDLLNMTLINKFFPVVYPNANPSKSEMLLSKNQYLKFKVTRPASLKIYFRIIDSISNVIN
ncbi:hypothetical protein EXU57_06425 [Segetibacter sp. 3557_3]|uniref:hypothetical protein n=1 Tax=Segetibacter sp. 3557_3 TaxID=2547429 RepID=UPI001058848F|nr:hypothetical protein [Segetibacter sp. 3557_3]TDH28090.1 hypothetical protein EXU57_06425 [Segetibacter sp. 3557_3]